MIKNLKKAFDLYTLKSEIDFAVLFGSEARGKARSQSDVDVAVKFKEKQHSLEKVTELQTYLYKFLKREDVEVVDIDNTSPTFKMNIAREGIVIFESTEDKYLFWKLYAKKEWEDTYNLRIIKERQLKTL